MSNVALRVYRSGRVESVHRAHIAVVNPQGKVIAQLGNPQQRAYIRSAAKPFQVMPLLLSGAAEHFGFTDPELAVMCASHNGEPAHVEMVTSILEKIGLSEDDLRCGAHLPLYEPLARRMMAAGDAPSAIHNNCSGKHAGMLAACVYHGWPAESYLDPRHPLQQQILKVVAQYAALPAKEIGVGVDGCSAPVFYLPIRNMALMYARLAEAREQAADRVFRAMSNYPELVAGTGRQDTELMQIGDGRLVSKVGAEGIRCVAVRDEEPWGVALKIEDGARRASGPVMLEVLQQLGLLDEAELDELAEYYHPELTNHAGLQVGSMSARFSLQQTEEEESKVAERKIEELEESVRAEPDNPDLRLELGIAYGELRMLEKAAEHLEKAAELAPERADIHYNLGVIYSMAMMQDMEVEDLWESHADEDELYHLAEQAYLRALELDPELVQAYNNLGTLYSLWGRSEDAVRYWTKSLELDPDQQDIREAIAEVSKGKE